MRGSEWLLRLRSAARGLARAVFAPAVLVLSACAPPDSTDDGSFRAFLPAYEQALRSFLGGDNTAWKSMLSADPASTLFTPFGELFRGPRNVAEQYDRAAARFADDPAEVRVEYVTVRASGDLGYAVALERSTYRFADRDTTSTGFTRASMVFVREAGQWRLVHRHMDHIEAPPG